jgi:hypothetical protein
VVGPELGDDALVQLITSTHGHEARHPFGAGESQNYGFSRTLARVPAVLSRARLRGPKAGDTAV